MLFYYKERERKFCAKSKMVNCSKSLLLGTSKDLKKTVETKIPWAPWI